MPVSKAVSKTTFLNLPLLPFFIMKIGYARVSTQDQSLDLQLDALEKAGCEKNYLEKMSGMRDDRPQLHDLLKYAKEGDVHVVELSDELQDRWDRISKY